VNEPLTMAELVATMERLAPKIIESRYVKAGEVLLLDEPAFLAGADRPRQFDEPLNDAWSTIEKLEWAVRNGVTIIRGTG
jgi:hypothetical protein